MQTVTITGGDRVGAGAFSGCSNLTDIIILAGVKNIDNDAFYNCTCLITIDLPEEVTSIGTYAFSAYSSLTIYCEVSSQPTSWDSNGKPNNRPVYWRMLETEVNEYNDMQFLLN